MQSCSIHHCILFSFTLTLTTVPALATVTPVTVKLHQSAKLLCKNKCSGVVKWTMFQNPGYVLAQCDQTSCSSVDEYKISHDEYVKGDVSLTITAADYTHRGLYTCNCNSMDDCAVRLSIETLMSSVELNSGEDLLMDLPVPQPLEVIYKPKDSSGLYGEKICTVAHQILQCKAEYTPRASLSYPELTLRDVNITDSGIYTIRDTKNDEDIHIYTLTVKEIQRITNGKPVSMLAWLLPALALIMVVAIMGGVCLKKNRSKLVKQQQLEQERLQHLQLEKEHLLQQQLKQERLLNLQLEQEHLLQQQLLNERAESLKYIESLEQYLGNQMLLHETEAQAYMRQRRTYSEPDLDRIVHKEDLKIIIQEYNSLPRNSKLIHLQVKSKRNARRLPVSSNSKTHVLSNENASELDESLKRMPSNPDVLEVQAEEKTSLIQQDDAGAVMVNEQNRTAEYQKHVTLSGKPPCLQWHPDGGV